jgi:hypothetical protein
MSTNQTRPTLQAVTGYLSNLEKPRQRSDAEALAKLMESATGQSPVMWGPSIVGFGSRHYVYESGREGDTMLVGFSARKQALTIYGLFPSETHPNVTLASQLGPHTHGKGCLYIKDLSAIDATILQTMVKNAYQTKGGTP